MIHLHVEHAALEPLQSKSPSCHNWERLQLLPTLSHSPSPAPPAPVHPIDVTTQPQPKCLFHFPALQVMSKGQMTKGMTWVTRNAEVVESWQNCPSRVSTKQAPTAAGSLETNPAFAPCPAHNPPESLPQLCKTAPTCSDKSTISTVFSSILIR